MVIAIDGMAATGKTTFAALIAKKYNYINFNTGAIYRCIALETLNNDWDINNISDFMSHLQNIKINFGIEQIFLNGVDVTERIMDEDISILSTKIASIKLIKTVIKNIQEEYISKGNIVIEGRDISTKIAPYADIKFYLYATFDKRAERLHSKLKNVSIDDVKKSISERDYLDNIDGSFVKPIDAIEIDTTDKTIDEVYKIMIDDIEKKIEENK